MNLRYLLDFAFPFRVKAAMEPLLSARKLSVSGFGPAL